MLTMLKNLRRERKMTQGNLAQIFHISQTSVSKYETGEAVPDLEMVVKMADFFGVSLDDFIISYFTSGSSMQTLPVTIYSMTRRKVSPEINALSTIIFLVVVIVLILKNVVERRSEMKLNGQSKEEM